MKTTGGVSSCLFLLTGLGLLLTACSQKSAPPAKVAVAPAVEPSTAPASESSNTECRATRATGAVGTIDDFESDPARILSNEGRGGYWFEYDDGTGGKVVREQSNDGSRVLHVTSSGFTNWGAGVGATLLASTTRTQACGYDASVYSGIRFRARGRGRMRLQFASVATIPKAEGGRCTRSGDNCYDVPGVWVNLKEQWQTVELPFCALLAEGWGGDRAELNASELVNVQFRIPEAQPFELWLDELAFFSAGQETAQLRCGQPCPLDAAPSGARIDPGSSTAKLTKELTLHTFQQTTKSCGALTRRYLSFVPKRLKQRISAPVVMALHGAADNAESMQQYMTRGRFDELAGRDGFIVIYGNAAPGAHMNPSPDLSNSGTWRQDFTEDGEVDDVAYLLAVLDDLKARGVTSGTNAVYLTGISNGGGMVLKAAKSAPERFRGIAPVMAFDGVKPTPVPELRGKGLNRVLFVYSVGDPGLPPGYSDVQKTLPPEWATALGLPQAVINNPKRTELPDRIREGDGYSGDNKFARATLNSRATQYDMVDASTDARLRLVATDHAGHFWPNPAGETAAWAINRWGFRNQDFDTADLVWEFFSSRPAK